MNIDVRKVFRSTNLIGMTVKNSLGQNLGKIEEVVIDVSNGQLAYAALGCGGFLGVGSKLFAIPWDALCLKYDESSSYFVLDNIDADELRAAPGFDKSHWPDMGDPNWAQSIHEYYRKAKESPAGQKPTQMAAHEQPYLPGKVAVHEPFVRPEAAAEEPYVPRETPRREDMEREEIKRETERAAVLSK